MKKPNAKVVKPIKAARPKHAAAKDVNELKAEYLAFPAYAQIKTELFAMSVKNLASELETWQLVVMRHFAPWETLDCNEENPNPCAELYVQLLDNELASRGFKSFTKAEKEALIDWYVGDVSVEDLFLTRYCGLTEKKLKQLRAS